MVHCNRYFILTLLPIKLENSRISLLDLYTHSTPSYIIHCVPAHLCSHPINQSFDNSTVQKYADVGQELYLMSNIRMGKGVIFCDLKCDMVVGTRWADLRISKLAE